MTDQELENIDLGAAMDADLKDKTIFELEFCAAAGYFPDAIEPGADPIEVLRTTLQQKLAAVDTWKAKPEHELYSKPPASSPTSLLVELRDGPKRTH